MLPSTIMYTPAALLSCLLLIFSSIASAHIIEVSAGKKECFFEDLHINDKVAPFLVYFSVPSLKFFR